MRKDLILLYMDFAESFSGKDLSSLLKLGLVWFGLVVFHGILTLVGYLMPNSCFHTHNLEVKSL